MIGMKNKRLYGILLVVVIFISVLSVKVEATETDVERYYIGEVVNTGKDNGYSGNNEIKKDDPHFGWKLGEFYIEGFTRYELDEDGNPIFLKNVGDEVTLWFDLQQDISKLNGNKNLHICEDTNGYDEKFDIEQTNLKKGTLIIRHTNYQNKTDEPQIYTNYLAAKESEGAATQVLLCEEGDYEVSLLYEIMDDGLLFFNSYTNYRIDFKFSVRNGNTMVFPFDVVTGQELTNSAFTENGFYLDLANSRYLTIDIKREVLQEGLVEDVRFNKPATDGERYTEEGIYTITTKNQYTDVVTEKKIYVGTNSILKAHVVTGLSISEIEAQVAEGATIDENGNIILLSDSVPDTQEESVLTTEQEEIQEEHPSNNGNTILVVVVSVVVVILGVVLVFVKIKKRKASEKTDEEIRIE